MNKKGIVLLGLAVFMSFSCFAQQLKISDDKRHIVFENGIPFFWLGDTAWELFHRLDREEADMYLQNRADKGFNVLQAVVLAELDGLNDPNPYGNRPLMDNDPSKPNDAYYEHVDYIVDKANTLGMYIGMLPTWGDKFNLQWGVGPEVFNPKNAYDFGNFLGKRYKDKQIIWILGGDRWPDDDEDLEITREMARGIRDAVGHTQLITYHPAGGRISSMWFHHDDWLDLNMFQSSHGKWNNPNYRTTLEAYKLEPTKPVLDGEPCYEDHPINWNNGDNGWFDEFDSRRAGWWSMLAGACGNTYGNHNIWQMWQPGRDPIGSARTPWWQAIDQPGAFQAGYMRKFFESFEWQKLLPSSDIIKAGPNTTGKEILAAQAIDGSFAIAYAPFGSNFTLNLSHLKDSLKARWFNPRNNSYINLGDVEKGELITFDPPSDPKRGNDWVLFVQTK